MSYADKRGIRLIYEHIYIHAYIDVYEYTWKTTSENLQV